MKDQVGSVPQRQPQYFWETLDERRLTCVAFEFYDIILMVKNVKHLSSSKLFKTLNLCLRFCEFRHGYLTLPFHVSACGPERGNAVNVDVSEWLVKFLDHFYFSRKPKGEKKC